MTRLHITKFADGAELLRMHRPAEWAWARCCVWNDCGAPCTSVYGWWEAGAPSMIGWRPACSRKHALAVWRNELDTGHELASEQPAATRPVDLASRSPHFWATLDADSVRPYLPDLPILLPVASFQRRDYQLKRPPRLALHSAPVAVDTGAFAWFRSFSTYHFSAPQFAEWIDGVRPPVSWAVIPDRPTEDLCGPREVRRAQAETTEAIVHVLETLLDVPWSWTPVLQGRTVEDYLRHAVELAGILYDLAAVYRKRGLSFRVGLGSICRRGQVSEIHRIVASVATVLPGIPLHLFGAKVDVLNKWGNRPQTVVSCDSAAWNGRFGTDIPFINAERRRLGLSQREYGLQIALPRYAARVEATFSQTLLSLA